MKYKKVKKNNAKINKSKLKHENFINTFVK